MRAPAARHGGAPRPGVGTRPASAARAPRPPASAPTPPPPPPPPSSLIPETLADLAADPEHQALIATVSRPGGQAALTAAERAARRRALDDLGVPPFGQFVSERTGSPSLLRRGPTTTLQLNVGLYCNQACRHCHVESSPLRTAEMMDERTADQCLELAAGCASLTTLDLTGGAPELNAAVFRRLVKGGRALGLSVIDRCNLTVLSEPGQEDLAEFLAEQRVRVVASLPCYTPDTVEAQRGRGVFQRSIDGLKALNALGYGQDDGRGLTLDLVYNPGGAFLAPPQATLEPAYRSELGETYGIVFSNLLALNNMPIKRFADDLSKQDGGLRTYLALLVDNFNPATVGGLMCRNTVSVAWDGSLHDCDFNQQLAIGLGGRGPAKSVFELRSLDELEGAPIAVGSHCFGCTAGSGSGCGGQA